MALLTLCDEERWFMVWQAILFAGWFSVHIGSQRADWVCKYVNKHIMFSFLYNVSTYTKKLAIHLTKEKEEEQ